ncbi:MAG: hypothetical protein FJW32_01315, partial [Acidobacteria bacterium]|nr:hypothetical protein [Acidobacteriota bacterium]
MRFHADPQSHRIHGAKYKEAFFLVLSTNSPHNPFLVPDAMKGKSQAGPRGDLVTVVDWAVGEIDARLAKHGLTGNTL